MTRHLSVLLAGLSLVAPAVARAQDDDPDDPPDTADGAAEPGAKPSSPREGTSFSITLPLGYGAGAGGGGVSYGLSGAIGGGTVSIPLYIAIADGGDAGGEYMVGVRINARKVFYAEGLVGWVKGNPYYPAMLGVGAGLGFDIPVYHHFTVTLGGTLAYELGEDSVFGMAFVGPTLHL